MRLAERGEEYAQIIINLGRGRYGGARIRARTALLDRDRRRKTFNKIDVRFLHLIEKLPSVGGKAFDVASLAFRVEGVESQRRFARAA